MLAFSSAHTPARSSPCFSLCGVESHVHLEFLQNALVTSFSPVAWLADILPFITNLQRPQDTCKVIHSHGPVYPEYSSPEKKGSCLMGGREHDGGKEVPLHPTSWWPWLFGLYFERDQILPCIIEEWLIDLREEKCKDQTPWLVAVRNLAYHSPCCDPDLRGMKSHGLWYASLKRDLPFYSL